MVWRRELNAATAPSGISRWLTDDRECRTARACNTPLEPADQVSGSAQLAGVDRRVAGPVRLSAWAGDLSRHLRLHPIVILVGVLVMAQLVGIAGLLLSAPLVATLRLFGAYAYRKVLDLDPWPKLPSGTKSKPRVG